MAHKDIDLKNPKTNRNNPGFTDEERTCFSTMMESGFVDTFRHFYPELEGAYSWWSYRFKAREKNAGWRIDYFLVSPSLDVYKRQVLEVRIGSLLRREMKEMFDTPKSMLAPEEWLKRPVIIELESLGEGPANFVTLLLCTLIRETLKANPLEDKERCV